MALNQTVLIRAFYECMWMVGLNIAFKNNQVRGWYGEWLARKYLQKRNFYILQKNWQSPLDARREIDLIARYGECLVFIEVRSRSIGSLNTGYHTINHKKRSSLLNACRDFLRIEFPKFPNYRFDVIEVDLCKTSGKVLHHENVSLFP